MEPPETTSESEHSLPRVAGVAGLRKLLLKSKSASRVAVLSI